MPDGTKKCSRCLSHLPLTEFHRSVKYGKPYTYAHCKQCQRAYVQQHYLDNRDTYVAKAKRHKKKAIGIVREKLAAYLKEHPCIDCGEPDLVVLQFDHVKGEKKTEVSRLVTAGFPWETVEVEIRKCEVRCANCHTRKTATSFGWWNSAL